MIEKPTVLILGAGASNPYGYPIGSQLKDRIIQGLSSETSWVVELGFDTNLVTEFITKFAQSPRPSIDSFLEYHKEEFAQIGKIAIVDAISKCEPLHNNINNPSDDWYSYLAKFIYDCPFESIGDNEISIISYNYDRSLEHYLYQSLLASYKEGEDPNICINQLKQIPIIHMYGRLDPLDWEEAHGRAYGSICQNSELEIISNEINLIHEAKKSDTIASANELIDNAEKIYFLGLDLRNRENLEILDLSLLKQKDVLFTSHGLRKAESIKINQFLSRYIHKSTANSSLTSLNAIRDLMPFE